MPTAEKRRALILVDLQNDFCPGGALAVRAADEVVPVANALLTGARPSFDWVVATQDWHPADHGSFAANHPGAKIGELRALGGLPQVMWPVHCVQGSEGAALVAGLDRGRIDQILLKGTDPAIDSYSGFFDNGRRRSTGLAEALRGAQIGAVYVLGLATDYCVKFTVLDALELGFATWLVEDGCRGVDLHPGDARAAVEAMRSAGATITSSADQSGKGKSSVVGRQREAR